MMQLANEGGPNAVIIADQSTQQQQLMQTANQDTIYMSGVLDLSDGPMVMSAGLLRTMNDIRQ